LCVLISDKQSLNCAFFVLFIELDRIHIRYSPNSKGYVDLARKLLHDSLNLKTLWDHKYSEILEYHEQGDLLDRGKFLRNYYNLKPPYVRVGTRIPQGILNICHESRWCYVYGQYSACIAISRSVIETVLKRKYKLDGYIKDIINIAEEKGFISKKARWNAHKVRVLANNILHEANVATENQAKESLDYVLNFIEEVYFSASYK